MEKLYIHIFIIIFMVDLLAQIPIDRINQNSGNLFFAETAVFEYSDELNTEIIHADDFELSQNYPNPFNPSTVITYKLPEKSFVSLKVYNVLGNEITTLVNTEKSAGIHNIKFDVSDLPGELSNGTYFYMLKAGNFTETKKMIYIK